jgi:hypothetical protein
MDYIDHRIGDHTVIRCSAKQLGPQMFIDVRKWVHGDNATEMFPTRKGILINQEHIAPLIEHLKALSSANITKQEDNTIT